MNSTYLSRDTFGMYAHNADGPGPALMGADTLLGNDVYNQDNEKLGDIKEFMLDMATGKVAYAVLSFGGLLGMGDKLFAVPWAALKLESLPPYPADAWTPQWHRPRAYWSPRLLHARSEASGARPGSGGRKGRPQHL